MRFTYRIVEEKGGWLAECLEVEIAGEGRTSSDAVRSLREALEERMLRPDAVAPPAEAEACGIELELAGP
jgi:hypothetical protein